jgi:N-acetyl sugar amidotransferase
MQDQPVKIAAQQSADHKNQTICKRCIMDTTIPGITFDENGICNFCHVHDRLESEFPLNEAGQRKLDSILRQIRRKGKYKKYDCILGISGGRDSTYTLYLAKKVWGLRPLAVHFNDGFGNPVAGENMRKATKKLGVDLRTITSDWRESKDLKIAGLKSSTPDIELGTDIGIATALYGVAAKENVQYILFGQSFRTEGICPLSWNYLDGKYLKALHKQFGTVPLRKWKPTDPGFNLELHHMFYYAIWRGIKTIPVLYYLNYVRSEADEIIKRELDWVYTGAHYYDDLFQSLLTYIFRIKFNEDRRLFNYSALVRSGQMTREEALERVKGIYIIEDPKVIDLCIKRLGLTKEELDEYIARPPRKFYDYPSHYQTIRKLRPFIKFLCNMDVLPGSVYDKYFNCGA